MPFAGETVGKQWRVELPAASAPLAAEALQQSGALLESSPA